MMIRLLTFIRTAWLPCAMLILAGITVLSLWPLGKLPAVPGGDKLHHLIAYAALMFPVALRRPNHWKLIGLFFIAYSGAIELLQPYVNRYGEWLDWAMNTAGIACGLLLAELIGHWFPTLPDEYRY